MTNSELIEFVHGLRACADLTGVKFTYAVAKNLRRAKGPLEDIDAAQKPSAAYDRFNAARIKLCEEHAEKDERNRPIMTPAVPAINGQPAQPEAYVLVDHAAFEHALETLRKSDEHKDAVEARKQQLEDFMAFLQDDSGFIVYTLAHDLFPEDITAGRKTAIYDMITPED